MASPTAYLSAHELITLVRAGDAAPSDIARSVLDDVAALDGELNAFACLDADDVMAQARALDDRLARGEDPGPLAGLPVPIKDLIAVGGQPVEFGSRVMKGNVAAADAPSVERIRRAGAVIFGKTTTSEFGGKAVGDCPATGITRNPWDPAKTPGGSSAGAAALVAAGIVPIAIGTDGGGSIRIPASLTGLFGFKGTFGRVPVYPVAATPTLAHVGPLTRNVRDAALMMSVISGFDARDPHSVAGPVPAYAAACDRPAAGLRIAYSPTLGYAKADARVLAVAERAVERLAGLGCSVSRVDHVFDDPEEIWGADFYTGVATRLEQAMAERRQDLDPALADVLDQALGRRLTAYTGLAFERYRFRDRVREFFEDFDVLATPTLPVTAFDVGLNTPAGHEDRNAISWVYYTYPFNLTGQPAASLPAGLADDGLPVGLQIVGRTLEEETLFRLAAAFEAASPDAGRPRIAAT